MGGEITVEVVNREERRQGTKAMERVDLQDPVDGVLTGRHVDCTVAETCEVVGFGHELGLRVDEFGEDGLIGRPGIRRVMRDPRVSIW